MDVRNLNLETLKSSLLFNFRTGNVALDTIMTGLIICLSTYLMNLASRLQQLDYRALFEKWFGGNTDLEPQEKKIILTGKDFGSGEGDAFLALIYRIKKLNCTNAGIYQLSEIFCNMTEYDPGEEKATKEEENPCRV